MLEFDRKSALLAAEMSTEALASRGRVRSCHISKRCDPPTSGEALKKIKIPTLSRKMRGIRAGHPGVLLISFRGNFRLKTFADRRIVQASTRWDWLPVKCRSGGMSPLVPVAVEGFQEHAVALKPAHDGCGLADGRSQSNH